MSNERKSFLLFFVLTVGLLSVGFWWLRRVRAESDRVEAATKKLAATLTEEERISAENKGLAKRMLGLHREHIWGEGFLRICRKNSGLPEFENLKKKIERQRDQEAEIRREYDQNVIELQKLGETNLRLSDDLLPEEPFNLNREPNLNFHPQIPSPPPRRPADALPKADPSRIGLFVLPLYFLGLFALNIWVCSARKSAST